MFQSRVSNQPKYILRFPRSHFRLLESRSTRTVFHAASSNLMLNIILPHHIALLSPDTARDVRNHQCWGWMIDQAYHPIIKSLFGKALLFLGTTWWSLTRELDWNLWDIIALYSVTRNTCVFRLWRAWALISFGWRSVWFIPKECDHTVACQYIHLSFNECPMWHSETISSFVQLHGKLLNLPKFEYSSTSALFPRYLT